MCCFSRPVEHVSQTKIFARSAGKDRQYVVYSMTIDAKEDLAMILPIPVPEKSPDDAVKFINLEKYPEFFADLKKGFPEPPPAGLAHSLSRSVPIAAAKKLDVVTVGSFEASFVPTVTDFSRLDERFRLPNEAWDELPQYKTFGFAVFKLKEGKKTIHPMAFDFPSRPLRTVCSSPRSTSTTARCTTRPTSTTLSIARPASPTIERLCSSGANPTSLPTRSWTSSSSERPHRPRGPRLPDNDPRHAEESGYAGVM